MGELVAGLAEYFTFYNGERQHQSLGKKTTDVVCRTGMDGGAMIVDKYPRAVEGTPVPLPTTRVPSTAESKSELISKAKPGQRRPTPIEVECTA